MGEDVVLDSGVECSALDSLFLELERDVVGPASPENRIDGTVERTHTIIAGETGTVQPVDVAIGASNVAICAGRDVDDDLPHDTLRSAGFRQRVRASGRVNVAAPGPASLRGAPLVLRAWRRWSRCPAA